MSPSQQRHAHPLAFLNNTTSQHVSFRRYRIFPLLAIILIMVSFTCYSLFVSLVQCLAMIPQGQAAGQVASQAASEAVRYVEVPSGRPDAKRYIAMTNSANNANNDNNATQISIQSWMELVSSSTNSDDNDVASRAIHDLNSILSSSSYSSFMFEIPGSSYATMDNVAFEFVLVNEPALQRFVENRGPDRSSFREHFDRCVRLTAAGTGKRTKQPSSSSSSCCSFDNLGGDARLIAPLPSAYIVSSDKNHSHGKNDDTHYTHLANFARNAPSHQILEFWQLSARQYLEVVSDRHDNGTTSSNSSTTRSRRTSDQKTWFSTAGMGVAWLHLRLDSRPKYYTYEPFTK